MNMTPTTAEGYNPRESSFSSLLARENIRVEFVRGAKTASFNLDTRHLVLPVYKSEVPDNLIDTLVYHEVAHALHSDLTEYSEICKRHGSGVANLFEDIVIEKLIKEQYPGAARIMPKGHAWKYENLIDGDINTENFLSRLMAYFKTADLIGVNFDAAERNVVNKINEALHKGASTEELIQIWKDSDLSQNDEAPEPDLSHTDPEGSPGDPDEDESSEESSETSGEGDEENDEDEASQSGSSDEESDDDGEESEDESDNTSPSGDSAGGDDTERGEDEDIVTPDESDLFEDAQTGSGDISVVTRDRLNKILNTVLYRLKTVREDNYNTPYGTPNPLLSDLVGRFATSNTKEFAEVKEDTDRIARELLSQFEQLAAARQYTSSQDFDTGEIDFDLLHEYKLRDDLFVQETISEDGVNHGFVSMVDFSGSMFGSRGKSKWAYTPFIVVLRKMLVLAKFCNLANIPYRAYAFTGVAALESHQAYREMNAEDDLSFQGGIVELFHENMDSSEYELSVNWATATIASGHAAPSLYQWVQGGTPLAESMMLIPELVRGMYCDKLTAIVLTDGQALPLSFPGKSTRGQKSYFIAPEYSNKSFRPDVTGAAMFIKEILPDLHLTYYYVGESLSYSYSGQYNLTNYNLQTSEEGHDFKYNDNSFSSYTERAAKLSKIGKEASVEIVDFPAGGIHHVTEIEVLGFDSVFLVSAEKPGKSTKREGTVMSRVDCPAIDKFLTSAANNQIMKQFASEFITAVA